MLCSWPGPCEAGGRSAAAVAAWERSEEEDEEGLSMLFLTTAFVHLLDSASPTLILEGVLFCFLTVPISNEMQYLIFFKAVVYLIY